MHRRIIKHNNLLVWSVFIVQAFGAVHSKVNDESDGWHYEPEVELRKKNFFHYIKKSVLLSDFLYTK